MHHVYLRISTDHQDEENQKTGVIAWMVAHGNPPMIFHTDTISGATPWRDRKLAEILDQLDEGDHIVTSEVSRIGRSTVDVLDFFRAALARGVIVIVTKSGLIVDHSLQSKINTTILALAAEIEREFLLARTAEGYRRARAAGVQVGRPKGSTSDGKLASNAEAVNKLLASKVSHSAISRIFQVSRGTVARFVARQKAKQREGQ